MEDIKNRIQNPKLLQVLLYRTDAYNDSMLEKTIDKITHIQKIATSFGFDSEIAVSIGVMLDLATPCYGEIGDRFLKEIDSNYTRVEYAERLVRKVFYGIDARTVDTICKGVRNVDQKKHTTPEEQIALMMQNGLEYSNPLKDRAMACVLLYKYRDIIIDKTAKKKVLTDCELKANTAQKREKIKLSPKETNDRMMQLKKAHQYFITNFNEIPEDFKEGWGNIKNELLAAYYVVGSDDKFLREFAKD